MNSTASIDQVKTLINAGEFLALRPVIAQRDAVELAALIESLPGAQGGILFRLLPTPEAARVFMQLSSSKQLALVEMLDAKRARLISLFNTLAPDDRTALFEQLPGEVTQRLLALLEPKEREAAIRLLGYPEDSIGRLMTTDYVAVRPAWTVGQALRHIRRFGKDSETINVIYIVERGFLLVDDLRIRDFILADPEAGVQSLMDKRFIFLRATDDRETAIETFRKYDRVALPVTDAEGVLLGIVTIDDVLDVAQEEATEDFHKFGSIQDRIVNPLQTGITHLYRYRITWLFALVLVNVFSGAAIAHFEETIQSVVALIFFLPLLIDSGGNAGSQSATLMIRALATGEAYLKDWLKLMAKEIPVALLLGGTMALGVAVIAGFRAPEVLPVVAATMICIVLVSSLVGLSLPFVFTRLKIDPATASAPLITSLADIIGVLIYFSIATWYFGL
jgi:magnesium transporter